jgi:hypothetical protein
MKMEENRWKRGWVYYQMGMSREKALEKADKEIKEMKTNEKQQ